VAGGLDCVGLVAFAYDAGGVASGYALRSDDRVTVARMAARAGLVRGDGRRPGDLILYDAGPGQLHLAIDSGAGVIHADAGLRRVVERPGVPPWREIGRWRRC